MVKSSELVISCEAAAASLSLFLFAYYGNGTQLPLEVLFPSHILYYLLTFSFVCPAANHIRKFACVFALVFGDMLLTAALMHKSLPPSFSVLCLQFICVFTVVHLLEPHEVQKQLGTHYYRGALFVLEGVLKSCMLVTTIQEVIVKYNGVKPETVLVSVILGSLRLVIAPSVYSADQYFASSQRLSQVNSEMMLRYLRLAPLISLITLVLLARTLPKELQNMQDLKYNTAHFVVNLAFIAWFAWDATGYGRKPSAE